MRESLYQLTLTLALPISVAAVWSVRGEPAGAPARETATAYRVELAELPLPTPERLRTPSEVFGWQAPRVIPEDPAPRHRRRALPNQFPPPPVELADDAGSQTAIVAPPSPRSEPDLPGVVPSTPLPAPSGAPALVGAAPAPVSMAPTRAPKLVAARVPAKDPATASVEPAPSIPGSATTRTATPTVTVATSAKAVAQSAPASSPAQPLAQGSPTQGATGSSLAKTFAQVSTTSLTKTFVQSFTDSLLARLFVKSSGTSTVPVPTSPAKSVAKESTPAALPSAPTPSRVAALDAVPGLLQHESAATSSGGPVSISDGAWGLTNVFSIVADRFGIAASWQAPIESPNGHAPLIPPGQTANQAIGLSLKPESQVPPVALVDLPLPALASAAPPGLTDRAEDFSISVFSFQWSTGWPTGLVVIPEPGSALLLGAALAALGAARRLRPRA